MWQVSSVLGSQAHSRVLNTKRERTRWQQLIIVLFWRKPPAQRRVILWAATPSPAFSSSQCHRFAGQCHTSSIAPTGTPSWQLHTTVPGHLWQSHARRVYPKTVRGNSLLRRKKDFIFLALWTPQLTATHHFHIHSKQNTTQNACFESDKQKIHILNCRDSSSSPRNIFL